MILLRRLTHRTLDTLFPPRCFACDSLTGEQGSLCADCWAEVDFISAPMCLRCGMPFPHETGDAGECMVCLTDAPPYDAARAVFRYEGGSRRLITGYKYYDRTLATPMFARWLARAGAAQLAQTDVIVPVPLHRWRLLRRRYNQSALLARELGRISHVPVCVDALQRTRHTPQQAGLTREERLENVRGAFAASPKKTSQIEGKRVMLVDDVLTTGATLHACTDALKAAGAQAVYILTLGRTTLDDI